MYFYQPKTDYLKNSHLVNKDLLELDFFDPDQKIFS